MTGPLPLLFRQTWLYSRFELHRLFMTPRGWFALAAFTTIWYFLLRYPIYQASVQLQEPEIQQMLSGMLGMVGMYNLLNWSLPELSVYWAMTVFFMPLAVMFSAADQTCTDRSRGTLRFLTLRSSRDSIFFGRFIGQLLADQRRNGCRALLNGDEPAVPRMPICWSRNSAAAFPIRPCRTTRRRDER